MRTFFRKRVYFRCRRPHFFVQTTSNFLKFMLCPHEQGLRQFGHFADKGNQIFAILCGRLLWTTQRYRSFLPIKWQGQNKQPCRLHFNIEMDFVVLRSSLLHLRLFSCGLLVLSCRQNCARRACNYWCKIAKYRCVNRLPKLCAKTTAKLFCKKLEKSAYA